MRSYGTRNIIIAEPSFLMQRASAFFRTRFVRAMPIHSTFFFLVRLFFSAIRWMTGLPWNKIYGISYALMCTFNYVHKSSVCSPPIESHTTQNHSTNECNKNRHRFFFFFASVCAYFRSYSDNKKSGRPPEKKNIDIKLMVCSLCGAGGVLQVTHYFLHAENIEFRIFDLA